MRQFGRWAGGNRAVTRATCIGGIWDALPYAPVPRLQHITVAPEFPTTHVCLLPAQPTDQVINIPIPNSIQILITISILIQWARAKLQDGEPKEELAREEVRGAIGSWVSDPHHIRASLRSAHTLITTTKAQTQT